MKEAESKKTYRLLEPAVISFSKRHCFVNACVILVEICSYVKDEISRQGKGKSRRTASRFPYPAELGHRLDTEAPILRQNPNQHVESYFSLSANKYLDG